MYQQNKSTMKYQQNKSHYDVSTEKVKQVTSETTLKTAVKSENK